MEAEPHNLLIPTRVLSSCHDIHASWGTPITCCGEPSRDILGAWFRGRSLCLLPSSVVEHARLPFAIWSVCRTKNGMPGWSCPHPIKNSSGSRCLSVVLKCHKYVGTNKTDQNPIDASLLYAYGTYRRTWQTCVQEL